MDDLIATGETNGLDIPTDDGMSDNLFGDISFEDIQFGIPRAKYCLELNVFEKMKPNTEKPELTERMFPMTFTIVDMTGDDERYNGIKLDTLFPRGYPKMTKMFLAMLPMDSDNKEEFTRKRFDNQVNFFRQLLSGMGVPDAEMGRFNVLSLDGKKFYATCYFDKSVAKAKLVVSSLTPAEGIAEKGSFADLI